MEAPESIRNRRLVGLGIVDVLLLWLGLILWIAAFLLGTLVDSAPYRASLATFEGGLLGSLSNGVVVLLTYTLTNVGILSVLAGLLGTLGAKARLGTDADSEEESDTTSPRSSSVLRAFLVYLLVISGLLILGDDPASPTQKQYVRLAGFISLLGFVVNYRPKLFGRLLQRVGSLIEGSGPPPSKG